MLGKYQVGFALYDPSTKEMVLEKDADKYFTPASNTKLFTFYAGLKITPDSIPSLRYVERGDSLIFLGNRRPLTFAYHCKRYKGYSVLKKHQQKTVFRNRPIHWKLFWKRLELG